MITHEEWVAHLDHIFICPICRSQLEKNTGFSKEEIKRMVFDYWKAATRSGQRFGEDHG